MELELGENPAPMTLRERYAVLSNELAEIADAAGRGPTDVSVLAVTKQQSSEAILAAIELGLHDIGENYLQEAREKFATLQPAGARLRKHFLGHVQTNKARAIVEQFDVVQSVDRIETGRALAEAVRETGKPIPVLIQLNISPVARFGAHPDEAERLAEELRAEGLTVDGVMAIGPITTDQREVIHAFERAAQAFARVGGSTLSLGMSADWRQAVRCGSTMIRIGSALFGARARARKIPI